MSKTTSIGKITKENYKTYVFEKAPKSSHFKNMFWAYFVGGLICALGQVIIEIFVQSGVEDKVASMFTSCILIALAACATGFGFYDKLGRFAGAGSTVPITGFSNAMVAPAIEFRSEGMIYGLGAKMFTVAGPVLAYGISASVIFGFIYYLLTI